MPFVHHRHDIHAHIHKALRAHLSQTMLACGRADWDDREERDTCLADIRQLLAACQTRLDQEGEFIHPRLEALEPGVAARAGVCHLQLESTMDDLSDLVQALDDASPPERETAGVALYGRLAMFVAEFIVHMGMIEREHNKVLWHHFSDSELRCIEAEIVASMSPERQMFLLRWMIPNLNPDERLDLVRTIRRDAPADAVQALMNLTRSVLTTRDWTRLVFALGGFLHHPVAELAA
ncbi:hypothetical protein [Chitinimonas sp. BJYL2]|uniref:hypothetical protein n=1 Tax=Chitinimonas sp. BJYL2 TaxID=2976696 RepID=UPI0022B3BC9E|nr:hypothetical protein [Chitinimonas sp. BJYL2]